MYFGVEPGPGRVPGAGLSSPHWNGRTHNVRFSLPESPPQKASSASSTTLAGPRKFDDNFFGGRLQGNVMSIVGFGFFLGGGGKGAGPGNSKKRRFRRTPRRRGRF